jgi:hypothetical protein
VSAYWFLPLDSISYAGLDRALGDDAERLYVSAAAYESRHPTVANYPTVELATLKDLSQELADLFGLTLPVPFKEQAHRMARCQ